MTDQGAAFACSRGYCDRPAVAAVYVHGQPGAGPTVLIRPDHLEVATHAPEDWRCLDCLHDDIDHALGVARL